MREKIEKLIYGYQESISAYDLEIECLKDSIRHLNGSTLPSAKQDFFTLSQEFMRATAHRQSCIFFLEDLKSLITDESGEIK